MRRKPYCKLEPWLKERLRLDVFFSDKTNRQLADEYCISEQLVGYYRKRWVRKTNRG